jgi:hypothetical protein
MWKSLITNNTYDARVAGHHISALQIASPWRCRSRIIPNNRTHQAHTQSSTLSVDYDMCSKVAPMVNKDMFIFG